MLTAGVPNDFEGKRITVMGLGAFGGGAGVSRYLASRGADVLVTDSKPHAELEASVAAIRDLIDAGRVRLRLGEHNVSDFTDTDAVVANPAVPKPWDNRFLRAAEAAGVPILTEMALVIAALPPGCRTVGVTGSNGKSTTSAMIAHALRAAGRPTAFGGNIGGSLLNTPIAPGSVVVLELSSAMLHWLRGWSPDVAVVTTFGPNHLDWHGSLDHYRASKQNILAFQKLGDRAILGGDAHAWPSPPGVERTLVSPDDTVDRLSIPGQHNRRNAGVARHAALAADPALDHSRLLESLRAFPGLPHRLALVATLPLPGGGVARCFNDSKCTTPEACALALDAFEEPGEAGAAHVHLIAGGYDKKVDLSIVGARAARLAGLYTVGVTGPAIAQAARTAGAAATTFECGTLDHAVATARARLRDRDILLLSPACASWDQFRNYEERGDRFASLVAHGGDR